MVLQDSTPDPARKMTRASSATPTEIIANAGTPTAKMLYLLCHASAGRDGHAHASGERGNCSVDKAPH